MKIHQDLKQFSLIFTFLFAFGSISAKNLTLKYFPLNMDDCKTLFGTFSKSDEFEKNKNHYPRIERYSSRDFGDQNAGSQTSTDVNGRKVHLGRSDSQPFICRTTYFLEEGDRDKLLQMSMEFQPYFKEKKSNTSLEEYFRLSEKRHMPEHRLLFPTSLTNSETSDGQFFDCLNDYQKTIPQIVDIIWLNKNHWYVNNVFYRVDLNAFIESFKGENSLMKIEEEKIMKGELVDFIRFSYAVQAKLDEGYEELRLPQERNELPQKGLILKIALTPGLANSKSFEYKLMADGKLETIGNSYVNGTTQIGHVMVANILYRLEHIDFETYNLIAEIRPTEKDVQSIIIQAYRDGENYNLHYRSGMIIPSPIEQLYNESPAMLDLKILRD